MSILENKPFVFAVLNTFLILIGLFVCLEVDRVSGIFYSVKYFVDRRLAPTGRIFESARSASAFG